jgi:dTDP-4-amino-4,6-dideoxygalactose transaminase
MKEYSHLMKAYKLRYEIEGQNFLREIGQWTSIRQILVESYKDLVKNKKCKTIEELPSDEKRRIWSMAHRLRREREEGNEYMMELCRALYGFEAYLKLNP